jgi:hypothetical protein
VVIATFPINIAAGAVQIAEISGLQKMPRRRKKMTSIKMYKKMIKKGVG